MSSRDEGKEQGPPSSKSRSPLDQHSRHGSELRPPLVAAGVNLKTTSWIDDRLPEMLWAVLIRAHLSRDAALAKFRRVLEIVAARKPRIEMPDLSLTSISQMGSSLQEEVVGKICEPPTASEALHTLRLFNALPAKDAWFEALPKGRPDPTPLLQAVGATLWHQSLEATDCRWLRLMAVFFAGRFHPLEGQGEEWLG
jgi:hypothetical protein